MRNKIDIFVLTKNRIMKNLKRSQLKKAKIRIVRKKNRNLKKTFIEFNQKVAVNCNSPVDYYAWL